MRKIVHEQNHQLKDIIIIKHLFTQNLKASLINQEFNEGRLT